MPERGKMKEGTGEIIFLGGDGSDHEVRIESLIVIMAMSRTSIMVAIDKDRGMFDKQEYTRLLIS